MICNFKLGFEKRMMSGVKYTKFATVLLLSAGLSACAAERETVVRASAEADRPAVSTYRPIHKQLTETTILGSDSLNARYEEEKAIPAPTRPIIREDARKEAKINKDREFKKIITYAKAEKAKRANTEKKKEAAPVKNEPSVAYQAATILFADGSSTVVPEYQGEIRKIARLAKEKNAHITVYGFASSRTRDTDVATHKRINFNISLKRAESVAAALIRAGAPKKSVAVEALSDSMPLYQEVMPEGERLNRRAEIYVSY